MDISVVVISYNSEKFLKDNLDSLARQTVPFKQIIVVDNHSGDGSLEIVSRYPQVQCSALDRNSGYAGGANTGIRACRSDLVMVANADIILEDDFNEKVLAKFASDPELALLSPLILRFDKVTVDSAGQVPSRALYPLEVGYNRPLAGMELEEGPVFSVCGAATVFSTTALEKLKMEGDYYDEDFFIFWEDFDIGWRARLLGLKTLFFPTARVCHYRGSTLERGFLSRFSLSINRSALVKYHLVKNRYLSLLKNFRVKNNLAALPFIFLRDLIWVPMLTFSSPKIIIKLLKSGRYIKNALRKRKILKSMENE